MSELRFDGQVALVTGSGRGLGRAHALLLAGRGAKVVINDSGSATNGVGSGPSPAEEVVQEIIAAGGEAIANSGDVSSEQDAEAMVQSAIDAWGRIDIVINNAGINKDMPFMDISYEQFRRMIQVHLDGSWLVTHAAWPHMFRQGYGRVIFTTSQAALTGMRNMSHYGAAKWAVAGLARQLSLETGDLDIKVNALGVVAYTRLSASFFDKKSEGLKTSMAGDVSDAERWWQRNMRPDQIAPVAAWLSHKDCDVSGEIVESSAGHTFHQFLTCTDGYTNINPTPEDIRDNKALIFDRQNNTHIFRGQQDLQNWRIGRAVAAGADKVPG